MKLTHARLLEVLSYDKKTGHFKWNETRSRGAHVGQFAGTVDRNGYRVIGIDRCIYKAHRLAWFYAHGIWPSQQIDHIDRDQLNNSIINLRLATSSENQANRGYNKNNSTGYRGVTFHKKLGKYQASIRVDRKPLHLGTFSSAKEAGDAASKARTEQFGAFAAVYSNLTGVDA